MADLLIHSMSEFAELILKALAVAEVRDVVEIGVEEGGMTGHLIDFVERSGGHLTSIDPRPSEAARQMFAGRKNADLLVTTSIEAMSAVPADAYVIDGDHNYYTVLNESRLAWEQFQRRGRPFFAVYHDVGWPCARRDQYCDPARIPQGFLQAHTWSRGVTLGDPGNVDGGFRGEGHWACALREGGPRNGVLTAIEDFVSGKEDDLSWGFVPAVFGLGILFSTRAPWAEQLTGLLLPYHNNPLIERLERNRLECYLAVIALQDRHAAQSAA
jgi:hypothetical protein